MKISPERIVYHRQGWEYLVFYVGEKPAFAEFEARLNREGADGWELASFSPAGGLVVMKRPSR